MTNARPLSILLTALTLLGACGEEPPPPPPERQTFTIEATVVTDAEVPVAKVPILLDGKVVGLTDAKGTFTGTLSELPGETVTLGATAPDGYRIIAGENVTEVLKTATVNNTVSGVPVFLATTLESLKKDYFVWVKADCGEDASDCGGWPVKLDGEEVAKTNRLGYAHFAFTRQPRTDVSIEIGTSGAFKPENPTYELTLDSDSTVYRLGQEFKDPTKKKRVVRRPSGKKKKKGSSKKDDKKPAASTDGFLPPTPKDKKDGVIDLF